MNTLPEDIQDTIYKYKHHMEFKDVIHEIHDIVDFWCIDQLTFKYCKLRHEPMYQKCVQEFKCLADYEEHLFVDLKTKDVLDIIHEMASVK